MFNEAMKLLNADRYDEAITTFNNILYSYPDFDASMIHYGLGVAYDSTDQLENAENSFKQCIQANVSNFEAHIFLGNVYTKMGRRAEAIAEFEFVIENNPNHELVPGLKAQVEELRNYSADGARARLIEEVEAFRHLVKTQFKIVLPYDMKGIELLNMIMDTGWSDIILAGGFIGEVLVRSFGGQWVMQMPREESYVDGLGEIQVNPFELASFKTEKGAEFSLVNHFNRLREKYGFG
jgi:tetratricopeptide (TPR) repeat protein